ncbi:MAG: class I SAM-dependent methyltransferase [Promethearchaeota archaeon]
MNNKETIKYLMENIENSMIENKELKKTVKLLEAISLNIYKHCAKPNGKMGKLVPDLTGICPELCKWGLNLLNPNINGVFLEIGFGAGYLIHTLAKTIKDLNASGKIHGIDHSITMVEVAEKRNETFIKEGIVKIHFASVNKLPFPNEMFDTCITVNSVNFWSDLAQALKEIFRVLKKNGNFLVLETTFDQEIFPQRLKKNKITRTIIREIEDFPILLKKAGFRNATLYLKKKNQFLAIIAKK